MKYWTNKIKEIGMARVALAMKVTHGAVRRYVHGGSFPLGVNMRALMSFMEKELPHDDFIAFINSLAEDIMALPPGIKLRVAKSTKRIDT